MTGSILSASIRQGYNLKSWYNTSTCRQNYVNSLRHLFSQSWHIINRSRNTSLDNIDISFDAPNIFCHLDNEEEKNQSSKRLKEIKTCHSFSHLMKFHEIKFQTSCSHRDVQYIYIILWRRKINTSIKVVNTSLPSILRIQLPNH